MLPFLFFYNLASQHNILVKRGLNVQDKALSTDEL